MNADEDKGAEKSGNMRKDFTVLRFPTPSLSILSLQWTVETAAGALPKRLGSAQPVAAAREPLPAE